MLRWNESLTKSEIGRATNLSANAVSVIIRSLDQAGLILKDAPIRGRIGQPSTPVRLNPAARYYLGLKIGRRSADLVAIDFVGTVLASRSTTYAYPMPDEVRRFLVETMPLVLKDAGLKRSKVDGFGIAMPSQIWNWSADIGVSPGILDIWQDTNLAKLLPPGSPWQPLVSNDASAACLAETTFRTRGSLQEAMYLFIGTLIGGGVILNGSVFFGRSGAAGGFGPFRVPGGTPGADRLIDRASLVQLERAVQRTGDDAEFPPLDDIWETEQDIVHRWIEEAASSITHTVVSSLSVIDFQAVIIDGNMPEKVRSKLVERVRQLFEGVDRQGIVDPLISEGHFGGIARAIGAAALPLSRTFSVDQNTLLRNG
ncbi:ROK family protein [Rhodobacterales bacterium HKCCE3408]|nr:ROK family protein [Rhodobacterales bacterium HKCCE3408]